MFPRLAMNETTYTHCNERGYPSYPIWNMKGNPQFVTLGVTSFASHITGRALPAEHGAGCFVPFNAGDRGGLMLPLLPPTPRSTPPPPDCPSPHPSHGHCKCLHQASMHTSIIPCVKCQLYSVSSFLGTQVVAAGQEAGGNCAGPTTSTPAVHVHHLPIQKETFQLLYQIQHPAHRSPSLTEYRAEYDHSSAAQAMTK